jgi:uncharacterized membrane protein YdcZ (DUF606 family)
MGVLLLVPMIPAILGSVYPITPHSWMYPVPMLGQYVLLTGVLGARGIGALAFAIAGLVSLAIAALLVRTTARLFGSERIIFGR